MVVLWMVDPNCFWRIRSSSNVLRIGRCCQIKSGSLTCHFLLKLRLWFSSDRWAT